MKTKEELTGEELAQVSGGSGNDLDLITPGSIESKDKLKDASATAIYGRGANGVILITSNKEEN